MIKPAVIVTQPIHLDFPLWRYNMVRFKDYFDSLWISFSDHHQEIDYSNFIRAQLPFAHFVEPKRTRGDWRDDSVNNALDEIPKDIEHILFLEQDFFIKDEPFFEKVFKDDYKFIYFMEGDRVHPGFAVVRRDEIEKTSRDFSATPPKDHFGKFFDELSSGINIDELGVKRKEDYYHLNGLSQNYMCFKHEDPYYQPNQFLYYNWRCLGLPIENHPQFYQIEKAIENQDGHPEKHPFLDKFFPND